MVWSGLICPGQEPIVGPCEHDNVRLFAIMMWEYLQ